MALSTDDLYAYVQKLFQRGLVIIVGSGASCEYGLPSMQELAAELQREVPARGSLCTSDVQTWGNIASKLSEGASLEDALGPDAIPDALADIITDVISESVRASEEAAIARILGTESISALGRLFQHALRACDVTDVVTTNYDRLIEIHAARADLRVDTMYYGHTIGRLDETLSREELLRPEKVAGKAASILVRSRPHIRLAKPHGSLDWFSYNDQHYRSELTLPGSQQIIAPGGNKYRLGYEIPFDAQRKRANEAISTASALLFIGYGFNDEHLQTHLKQRFPNVPAVLIARTLTPSARGYLKLNKSAIGIEASNKANCCLINTAGEKTEIGIPLWNLEHLVKEVLGV